MLKNLIYPNRQGPLIFWCCKPATGLKIKMLLLGPHIYYCTSSRMPNATFSEKKLLCHQTFPAPGTNQLYNCLLTSSDGRQGQLELVQSRKSKITLKIRQVKLGNWQHGSQNRTITKGQVRDNNSPRCDLIKSLTAKSLLFAPILVDVICEMHIKLLYFRVIALLRK